LARKVERPMATTRRWVRFVVPAMVEVDCDEDEVTRVVARAEDVRPDRDDLGQFCLYDEGFAPRHSDEQPQTHAYSVAQPGWDHDDVRVGPRVTGRRCWRGSKGSVCPRLMIGIR
jgi:hypothetical protein